MLVQKFSLFFFRIVIMFYTNFLPFFFVQIRCMMLENKHSIYQNSRTFKLTLLSFKKTWQISEDLAVTNSECSFNSII